MKAEVIQTETGIEYKSAENNDMQSGFLDPIIDACANLSIDLESSPQCVAETLESTKKRRVDGSLKNDQTWSMKELQNQISTHAETSNTAKAQLLMETDNLKRRIAAIQDLAQLKGRHSDGDSVQQHHSRQEIRTSTRTTSCVESIEWKKPGDVVR